MGRGQRAHRAAQRAARVKGRGQKGGGSRGKFFTVGEEKMMVQVLAELEARNPNVSLPLNASGSLQLSRFAWSFALDEVWHAENGRRYHHW